jgi:FKBP-type peptidyl-prolyl cis-trans isomerase
MKTNQFYNKQELKMQLLAKLILFISAIALFGSCNKVDFKKTKGGMPYKLYSNKSGKKGEEGNILKLHLTQKIKDSVVFTTHGSLPVYIPVTAAQGTYDITEVIPLLKEGDSVYATQLMDTFIARNPAILQQTPFKKGDKIITTLKVLKVFTSSEEATKDEQQENLAFLKTEDEAVKKYIASQKITAQKTGKGTYVQILDPGQGPQVDSGKYVTVMYTGTSFSGKRFDSNVDTTFGHTDPLGFVVGQQQMIAGIDEGIRVLRKGGKARIFIPSMLAYGSRPPSPDIKPFEHLIFDVQVVDVKDKGPVQPEFPPQGGFNPGQPQQPR